MLRVGRPSRAGLVTKLAVAVLLATLSLQAYPQTVAAAYATSCATGDVEHNWTVFDRYFTSPGMSGVVGIVNAVNLRPCTNPSGQIGGRADIWGAALQRDTDISAYIVQIGIVDCAVPGAGWCDIFDTVPSGREAFVYTAEDANGGYFESAEGWYGASPILGHTYRFRIVATTNASGAPRWEYCMRDMTVGQSYICKLEPRTWLNDSGNTAGTGFYAWWGGETFNDHSAMGNGTNETPKIEHQAQFKRSGSWWWVDQWEPVYPDHGCHHYSQGTYPPYYFCGVYNLVDTNQDGLFNDRETVRPYTSDH